MFISNPYKAQSYISTMLDHSTFPGEKIGLFSFKSKQIIPTYAWDYVVLPPTRLILNHWVLGLTTVSLTCLSLACFWKIQQKLQVEFSRQTLQLSLFSEA